MAVIAAGACGAALTAGRRDVLAQQPALPLGTSSGLNGLLATSLVFAAADVNKDGAVSHERVEGGRRQVVHGRGHRQGQGRSRVTSSCPR